MAHTVITAILQTVPLLLLLNGYVSGRYVTKSEVRNLTDEYFDFKLRENPWFATKLGIDKYQDKVEEWNHAAFNRRIDESKAMLTRVDIVLSDDNSFECDKDKTGLEIVKYSLEVFIKGTCYRNYTVTLNADLANVAAQLRRYPVKTETQLDNWYRRVIALQSSFEDQLSLLDQAVDSGLTRCRADVLKLIEGLRKAISDSTENFFAFKPWLDLNVIDSNRSYYDDAVLECGLLRSKMIAYTDKMENDYLPVARSDDEEGVSYLPGGADFYSNTLKYYTHGSMTPELAHSIGVQESKRITDEMKEVSVGKKEKSTKPQTQFKLAQAPIPIAAADGVGHKP